MLILPSQSVCDIFAHFDFFCVFNTLPHSFGYPFALICYICDKVPKTCEKYVYSYCQLITYVPQVLLTCTYVLFHF